MGASERRKGSRGELDAAKLITACGFQAKRHGRHFHGLEGVEHADLIHNVPAHHIEVKWQESIKGLWGWIRQSNFGAKPGERPVVMFKKNRNPFFIVVEATHYFADQKELEELRDDRRSTEGS